MFTFFIALLLCQNAVNAATPITLNAKNHLVVRGEINAESASKFVYDSQRLRDTVRFVYIHSPGGSVHAGEQMVTELHHRNYTCIANTAYSMAFVLLQACRYRMITPYASLMQHQISIKHIGGELRQLSNVVADVSKTSQRLIKLQAQRIGVTPEWFANKTMTEWWLNGEEAIESNCADGLADVQCTQALTQETFTDTDVSTFGFFSSATVYEYSKCPLVHLPLRTIASASVPLNDN